MSIKSILCLFGGEKHELGALEAALVLALIHTAQVRFLHFPLQADLSLSGLDGAALIEAEIVETARKRNKKRLEQAKERVAESTAKHGVALDTKNASARRATARFIPVMEYADRAISREGRLSDLIILSPGVADPEVLYDYALIAALFETGRPVLLMPRLAGKTEPIWRDKTLAFAWDGGMESARALHFALPFIARAEKFHVLMAHEHWKKADVLDQTGLLDYLRAHDIHSEITAVDCGKHSIGEALLAGAREGNADLLIAGAYGHSRLREMILGGTTNELMEKARIPLLLCH